MIFNRCVAFGMLGLVFSLAVCCLLFLYTTMLIYFLFHVPIFSRAQFGAIDDFYGCCMLIFICSTVFYTLMDFYLGWQISIPRAFRHDRVAKSVLIVAKSILPNPTISVLVKFLDEMDDNLLLMQERDSHLANVKNEMDEKSMLYRNTYMLAVYFSFCELNANGI